MAAFCSAVLDGLGRPVDVVSIAFVGRTAMRGINRRYRGRNYATDVLSFGYAGESEDGFPLLGEIVISPEVAAAQASRWRTPVEREIRKLLVHGLLHLLGYDHEADEGEMIRLQRAVLRRKPAVGPPFLLRGQIA